MTSLISRPFTPKLPAGRHHAIIPNSHHRAEQEASTWIIILLLIGLGGTFYAYSTGLLKSGNVSNVSTSNGTCIGQPATAAWPIKFVSAPYGGDAAQSSPSAAMFYQPTGSSNLFATIGDSVGSLSSAVTTNNPYSPSGSPPPGSGVVVQSTASVAYPVWFPFTTSFAPASFGGGGLSAVTLPSGAPGYVYKMDASGAVVATIASGNGAATGNQLSCVWVVTLQNIQAPASGKSATTNVIASSTSSGLSGGLTYAGGSTSTVAPTSAFRVDGILSIKSSYKGAGYATTVWGTQQNPVTSYATGITYGGSTTPAVVGSVVSSTTEIVLINDTTWTASVDPAAAALFGGVMPTISQKITSGMALSSGTTAWVVTLPSGCAPAGVLASGQTSPCLDVPIDFTQSASSTNGHVAITLQFVDEQQSAYLVPNLTDAAKGSFSAGSSGTSGLADTLAGLTPTSGINAGAPAILIEQYVQIILCNTGTCT